MAVIHKVGAVKYEGPLKSTYIISFLDSILMPLVPLHHFGELLDLLTKHEVCNLMLCLSHELHTCASSVQPKFQMLSFFLYICFH